jgi:hypothetical protein
LRAVYKHTDRGLEFPGDDVELESLELLTGRSDDLTVAISKEFVILAERVGREKVRERDEFEGYGAEPDGEVEAARTELEELETAALAAAAIDITVAGDALEALRPEIDRMESNVIVPAAIEEEVPSREELDPLGELLLRADDEFPEGLGQFAPEGRAPGAELTERRVREGISELVSDAAPVVAKFGTGLLTVGVAHLLAALEGVSAIHRIVAELNGHVKCGIKLVDSGARKITSILGVDPVTEALRHFELDESLEQLDDALRSRTAPIGERILRGAVRARSCETRVNDWLQRADAEVNNSHLDIELGKLCRRYGKSLRWTRVIAKGLKWCAPGIVLVGGPVGIPAIAGANGLGLTFVLFTLADRLDTLPILGHARGVETICDRVLALAARHVPNRDDLGSRSQMITSLDN